MICPQCKTDFPSARPWQRFCGDACRNKWHTAQARHLREAAKLTGDQADGLRILADRERERIE